MSNLGFITTIAPLIVKEGKARGYKVFSTVIAQAIIESRWGESGLAKYHNYFGLKAGKNWKGKVVNMKTKEEYTVGQLTTITDGFRAYDNMVEGVKGYYDFISTQRYANLKNASSYREYAEMLKADGYATSSTYVNTLCNTVTKYGLTKYDGIDTISTAATVDTSDLPLLKRGLVGKSNYVRILQAKLNEKGNYGLALDGTFGPKTEIAVLSYQRAHNLEADGVVGKNTWNSLYS